MIRVVHSFDHDFVDQVMGRLSSLSPGTKPSRGDLSLADTVDHLAETLRYSMGKTPELPDQSTWVSRHVVGPLVLNRILSLPDRFDFPKAAARRLAGANPDLETLDALLAEYLTQVELGELVPARHPVFGALDVDDWAKLHAIHFEKHLGLFEV